MGPDYFDLFAPETHPTLHDVIGELEHLFYETWNFSWDLFDYNRGTAIFLAEPVFKKQHF